MIMPDIAKLWKKFSKHLRLLLISEDAVDVDLKEYVVFKNDSYDLF